MGIEMTAGMDRVASAIHRVLVASVKQRLGKVVDVAAFDQKAQSLARLESGSRRQNLDVHRHDLSGLDLERPMVPEDRLEIRRGGVQLAMGNA